MNNTPDYTSVVPLKKNPQPQKGNLQPLEHDYLYTNLSTQFFLFPGIDLQMFELRSPQQLYEFLEAVWNFSPLLKRFHWTLYLSTIRDRDQYQKIKCTAQKCKFSIKLSISNNKVRITSVNYWHNHKKIRMKSCFKNWRQNGQHVQPKKQIAQMLEVYGSHYLKLLVRQQIQYNRQLINGTKIDMKSVLASPQDFLENLQSYKIIREMQEKAIQEIGDPELEDNEEEQILKIKNQITKNALIEYEREIIDLSFNNRSQNQEYCLNQNSELRVIFYSSHSMQQNFKKWGKSVYIGEPSGKFYQMNKNNSNLKIQHYNYQDDDIIMANYIFCGCDHSLNIVVFGIGLISGPKYLDTNSVLPKKQKKRLMQLFFKKMPGIQDCQSFLVKQKHEDLVQILEELRKTDEQNYKFIIKYKIQSYQHVSTKEKNPYKSMQYGIVPALALLYHLRKQFPLKSSNIQSTNIQECENKQGKEAMKTRRKTRKIKIYSNKKYLMPYILKHKSSTLRELDLAIRKMCLSLNEANFIKAYYEIVIWLNSCESLQIFQEHFLNQLKYYALINVDCLNLVNTSKPNKELEKQKQDKSDNKQRQNKKEQNRGFIGFNLFIDFEYWLKKQKHQYFTGNLYRNVERFKIKKLFESTQQKEEQKQQMNYKNDLPYNCYEPTYHTSWNSQPIKPEEPLDKIQATFKNLILLFTQGNSKFKANDSLLENIGFNTSIDYMSEMGLGQSKRSKKVIHKTNKVLFQKSERDYFQYFLNTFDTQQENLEVVHKIYQRLPYFNLAKLYLSKPALHFLLGYELIKMIQINVAQIEEDRNQLHNRSIGVKTNFSFANQFVESPAIQIKNQENQIHQVFYAGSKDSQYRVTMTYPFQSKNIEQGNVDKKYIGPKKYGQNFKLAKETEIQWDCSCLFTKYMGIPCRHILKVMIMTDHHIINGFRKIWVKNTREQNSKHRNLSGQFAYKSYRSYNLDPMNESNPKISEYNETGNALYQPPQRYQMHKYRQSNKKNQQPQNYPIKTKNRKALYQAERKKKFTRYFGAY